ncbi:MAG: hypothetical protein CL927_17125 [Deltaproteobacteria bacterium]|nr:hypothetical protein [Deltaproteobacteria bacterium]HCH63495.1 hypothetical protein [Deltaproteobacteria bacterium]
MRHHPALFATVFISACVPKVEPNSEVEPNAQGNPIAEVEPDDAPQWNGELGQLVIEDHLAGRTLISKSHEGWESRSNAPIHAPGSKAKKAEGIPSERIAAEFLGARASGDSAVAFGSDGSGGSGLSGSVMGGSSEVMGAAPKMGRTTRAYVEADETLGHLSPGLSGSRSGDRVGRPRPVAQPTLHAGSTDDNAHFDEWLAFVDKWGDRADISGWADILDVRGRQHLQVLDARGRPIPDAQVRVLDPATERIVWAGRAYGDGRVPLYPHLEVPGRARPMAGDAPDGGWLVQASTPDGLMETVRWDGQSAALELVVDTKGLEAGAPVPVDVCFIIDTTGSMGDEISRIKTTLLRVTDKLRADAAQGVDLRYGAVLYRDVGDEYVTRRHAFTEDLEGFDRALKTIAAAGGGDGPESLNQGLAVGVAGMEWRDHAARVAFVVADAPPHMDYQGDVSYGRAAAAAVHRGIRIHTVAASGLDDRGSFAFRQIAQLTRGQFIYIEYGSAAASAADHGVRTPKGSNNLDDILYGRIRAEIDGWGKHSTEAVARR